MELITPCQGVSHAVAIFWQVWCQKKLNLILAAFSLDFKLIDCRSTSTNEAQKATEKSDSLTDFLKARQIKRMAQAAKLLIASWSWREDKENPRNAGKMAGRILKTVSQKFLKSKMNSSRGNQKHSSNDKQEKRCIVYSTISRQDQFVEWHFRN